MANIYATSSLIAKETLNIFQSTATFVMNAETTYDSMYEQREYNPGDTIQIRYQNRFETQSGNSVTVTDLKETTIPMTLQPLESVALAFNVRDMKTKLRFDEWRERVLVPAAQTLGSRINQKIAELSTNTVNYFTGAAGTPISTFKTVELARIKLKMGGCMGTNNKKLALTFNDSGELSAAMQNTYNKRINKKVTSDGYIRDMSQFELYEEESIPVHVNGTDPGTMGVGGATSSGNTINYTCATAAGTLTKGTLISIAGAYQVSVQNKASFGHEMQYVLTEDSTFASNSGTMTVSPEIIISGPNQNVSNALANGAIITVIPSHNSNLAWGKGGLLFVSPKLPPVLGALNGIYSDTPVRQGGFGSGLSIAVTKDGDTINYKNIMRLSVLWGALWVPQRVVKVLS